MEEFENLRNGLILIYNVFPVDKKNFGAELIEDTLTFHLIGPWHFSRVSSDYSRERKQPSPVAKKPGRCRSNGEGYLLPPGTKASTLYEEGTATHGHSYVYAPRTGACTGAKFGSVEIRTSCTVCISTSKGCAAQARNTRE